MTSLIVQCLFIDVTGNVTEPQVVSLPLIVSELGGEFQMAPFCRQV